MNEKSQLLVNTGDKSSSRRALEVSRTTPRQRPWQVAAFVVSMISLVLFALLIQHDFSTLTSKSSSVDENLAGFPRLGSTHHRLHQQHRAHPEDENVSCNRGSYYNIKSSNKEDALTSTANIPQAVILLIRHCEDGHTMRQHDLSRHCNPLGYARAEHLASLFSLGDDEEEDNRCHHHIRRWPHAPSHLYTLIKSRNLRQLETLEPLANRTAGVPIQLLEYPGISAMASAHARDLEDMMTTISCHGNRTASTEPTSPSSPKQSKLPMITVVAWKHAYIPELAKALGCDHCPTVWSDDDFDSVWELHYYYDWERSRIFAAAPTVLRPRTEEPMFANWNVYASLVRQDFDPLHDSMPGIYDS